MNRILLIKFLRYCLFSFLFLATVPVYAQLSDLHYLPPLKQSGNGVGIVNQAIYLSTPVTTPFTVNVYKGTNTTPVGSFSLSKTSPYVYALASNDNNITLVDNANTGLVISNSGLRFESENGEKFYVNYRGTSASQGSSLTSKGRSALGKKFRWGGGPVIGGQDINATLGIMATEDGTKIEITGYDPSIAFRQGSNVSLITDNTISKTLNKGQSFVLEYYIGTPAVLNDKWLGASIVSDKNIAVSVGNALYSSAAGGGRDIAIDQIIPENVLGSEYVFVRGYGSDNLEFPIIIATQNGTEIYVNDSLTPIATIDAGEYFKVPGSNYSGSGTTRPGENLYVRASKQVYAFQSTAGADNSANVDYNFIAPVNFLLDKQVDFIPSIEKVASATITGGISIISAASTPDADVKVLVNGVNRSLSGKRKAIVGTGLWVTYFLDGLNGNVSVSSSNSIAVGYTGQSGVIGVSGYFSGFETIPSIDVSVAVVGNCLQDNNVTLSAPSGYAIYQWYLEGKPVSGGTQRILTPTLPGTYTVGVTSTAEGKEYVSAPVDVSDCLPEIKIDVTSTNQTISVGETSNLRVNYKYQSFFSSSNAEVALSIPSNFEISASSASAGSWSGVTKTWSLGNLNPGDEEVLELTLKAISTGNPLTVSATSSQTVYGSDNVTLLNEGGKLTDDLSEVFNIKNATVINVSTSISKTVLDPDFSLSATSNNPNSITYASSNEGVAKVDINGNVDIVSSGTATITLSQTATDTYGPGSKSITLTVSKVNSNLSGFSAINKTYGDPNFQLIKPASNGDGAFSYSSSNTGVATVNSSTGEITIKQAGTSTITATQAATANYNSSSITATLTVVKADQNIAVGTLPDAKTILELVGPGGLGTPIVISATSSSGSPVTISLPAGSIGTLSGTPGNYTLDNVSGPGTLTINFDVAANSNYNATSASVSLDVNKKPQNIVFNPAMAATVVYSDNLAVPITASSPSSADMVYAVSSGPATVSNGELLITGTGIVNYTVNNPGDDIYTEAPEVIKSLNISQGTTVLSNFTITNKTYGTSSFSIPVPTSNRSGSFTYTSSASAIASVSDGNIVINTPGSVTITATQPSTENWKAGSISTTFNVLKADPILSGVASISKTTIDPDFSYAVSSTVPSNPIVFRSSDLSVATVNSSTGLVSIKGIGTAVITASQTSTSNYNAASTTLTLTVTKANPTLGAVSNVNKVPGDANFTISAPSSSSGGSFTFTSSNTGVVTVNSNSGEVSIVGVGSSTITITQAATATYNSVSTTLTVTVSKLSPTIGSVSDLNKIYGDAAFSIIAPSSNSDGLFSYSSSNTNVATVNSGTGEVTIAGVGSTTITITQAETASYSSAGTSLTVTVSKTNPALGSVSNVDKSYGDAAFSITAPSSNSAGLFSYSSSNTNVATVNSATGEVTIVGVGSTTITITQAETATYNSAGTSLTITVSKTNPTLGSVSNVDKSYGDAAFSITAPSSNSAGLFSYSSSNTNVATVNSSTGLVSLVAVGSSTITINQAETVNYNAASTSFTLNVTAGIPTQIAIKEGNNQTTVAGSSVSTAPGVIVKDANGNPVAGVNVTFSVSSGGGTIAPLSSVTTDVNGIATLNSWTLGTTAGSNTIIATSGSLTGSPLTFTATGIAGPASLYLLSSSNYSAQGGTSVTITAQLADANGNAVLTSGKTVTWSSTNGGQFAANVSTTDAQGKASVGFKLSGTNAVVHTVKATDNTGLTGESTSITVNGGAGTKYLISYSKSSVVAGSSFTVTAQLVDANDIPVTTSGKVVTWSKNNPSGSFANSSSVTDANGKATVVFTTHTISGTSHVITSTDDENLQGVGPSITTLTGEGTQYTINADNSTPIAGEIVTVSVQLVDDNNNKVTTAGKTVSWTKSDDISVLPSSQTNSNGIATFIFTSSKVAGQSVVVTAKDVTTQKQISTTITTKSGPASKYVLSNETDKPVAGSVITVRAQLADVNGNAVSTAGLTVNWSKTDSKGSFETISSQTNASGLATVKFTTHTVAATSTTITATDNNNLKGTTGTITTQSGIASKFLFDISNFSPVAGTNVTVTATLIDANNNTVKEAGKTITWSKSDANGSFSSLTGVTNANGASTVVFTTHTIVNTSTVITASSAEGVRSSSDKITTIAAAPKDLNYSGPVVLTAGFTMQNLIPSVTGIVTEYSISPNALVRGLNFNKTNGIISGKPMAESLEKTFVITAKNNTGSTSFNLKLTVLPAPTPEVKIVNNKTYELKDDIISMQVETEDSNGNPNQIVEDKTRKDVSRNYLMLENSLTVKVFGSGFLPGSEVKVEMFSKPQLLGFVPVDSNGSFSAGLKVSPDTEIGTHTIKTTGLDITEVERKLNIGLLFNMQKPDAPKITAYTIDRGKVSIDFVDTENRSDLFTSRQYSIDNGLSWNFLPDSLLASPLILTDLNETAVHQIAIRVANATGFSDPSNVISVFTGDTDGDLVPDYVEFAEKSVSSDSKSFKDSDRDGVPDYVEESERTNSNSDTDFKDTDKGGVPDYVESVLYRVYGLNSTDIQLMTDDSRDTDHDGLTDYYEILTNTNPKDSPLMIMYRSPRSGLKILKGNSVKLLVFHVGGMPDRYSISPALPEGLSIDAVTGIISGTLTGNISGQVIYTINGSNEFGSAGTKLVLNYNSVPQGVRIDKDIITENNSVEALIGTLTANDEDADDAHTYRLPSDLAPDNAAFTIDGSYLKAAATFDYETKRTYSIVVQALDMSGASIEQALTINVQNANDAPVDIKMSASGMYENNVPGSAVASLSTTDSDTGDTHTYTIVGGDVSSFSISGNQLLSAIKYDYKVKKDYRITLKTQDSGGLVYEKELVIAIHQMPVIMGSGNEAGTKVVTPYDYSPEISKGFTSTLKVIGEDVVKYQWTADPSLSSLIISNPLAKPLFNTTYQLTVTNKSGATTVAYITVRVVDDFNITANNILTPDGDGVNDTWIIENIESYPNSELMIFDKAGRILFRQREYNNTWNGSVNGSVLTDGVYYYIIRRNQGNEVKKGYINLINSQLK